MACHRRTDACNGLRQATDIACVILHIGSKSIDRLRECGYISFCR